MSFLAKKYTPKLLAPLENGQTWICSPMPFHEDTLLSNWPNQK
jgi:hypothetical protein